MSQGHLVFEELPLPIAVIHAEALAHNVRLFADWCWNHGMSLAPHAKTTMARRIVRDQLAAGAWGMTAANVVQALQLGTWGVERVLIANEVVDPGSLRLLAADLQAPSMKFVACFVDSAEAVRVVAEVLTEAGARRRLPVLVEAGHPGGRCGVRTVPEGERVARAVAASDRLQLVGVGGFEGTIRGEHRDRAVGEFLLVMRKLVECLLAEGLFDSDEVLVTAGGSVFFDRVARHLSGWEDASKPVRTVLRSGCYVTHDSGTYDSLSPLGARIGGAAGLRPALEVWGAVLSVPEPGLAVLGVGKRDVSFDAGLPIPLHRFRGGSVEVLSGELTVTAINDQHAYLHVDDPSSVRVGDLLGLGISHPCTTFDRWRRLVLVDEDYRRLDTVDTAFH